MSSVFLKIKRIYKNIRHFFGKRKYCFFANRGKVNIKEKIVVFESDDWGTYRTFDKKSLTRLAKHFGDENDPFIKYDSLESKEDVERLMGVLSKHSGFDGKTPVFTMNFGFRSPNFKAIIESNYSVFFDKDLKDSYLFANKESALTSIKKGIKGHLFEPQLHAVHHINVSEWMISLKNNTSHKTIVDNFCLDYSHIIDKNRPFLFMDEMRDIEKNRINQYLLNANEIFKNEFGFYSSSFIPCCNVINSEKDCVFANTHIDCVQGSPYYFSFDKKRKRYFKHSRKWKNDGVVHLIRNCLFEPSLNSENIDNVKECLWQIKKAFKHNKPAIICTHRLNYIGSIDYTNQLKNLDLLDILLTEIEKKYPDVIYMSSNELARRIKNGN